MGFRANWLEARLSSCTEFMSLKQVDLVLIQLFRLKAGRSPGSWWGFVESCYWYNWSLFQWIMKVFTLHRVVARRAGIVPMRAMVSPTVSKNIYHIYKAR